MAIVKPLRIFISGWGFSWKFFAKEWALSCDHYIDVHDPNICLSDICTLVNRPIYSSQKIDIIGFSLGAYLACDVLRELPERIESLTLIGLRPNYPSSDISSVRELLISQGKDSYLPHFYRACFSTRQRFNNFKHTWMACMIKTFTTHALLRGLDYLEHRASFSPNDDSLSASIKVLHGEKDQIAPFNLMSTLMADHSEFYVCHGDGHCISKDALFQLV